MPNPMQPPPSFTAPAPEAYYNRPWPFYPSQMVPELVQLPNGLVAKNPVIDGVDEWYQLMDPNPTIALAANGRAEASWLVPPAGNIRGDAEILYLMSQQTGRYTMQGVLGGTYDRALSNGPITNFMMAGTSQLPHELAESIFMESAGLVNWTLQDVSGAPNNITLIGQGRQFVNYDIVGLNREGLIESYRQRSSHAYWLTFDQVNPATGGIALAAGQTLDAAITDMTCPGDGDFVAYGILDDSVGNYSIEMFSGRSGKRNSSAPVPRDLFAAPTSVVAGFPGGIIPAASMPLRWRQPRLFNRQTKIRFRITDLSGAPNTIRIALFGRKIYYPELGKAPIEVMGRNLVNRPMATSGSGNWSAVQQPFAGPGIWPGTGAGTYDRPYTA